jgi:hypothetical protein
MGLEKQLHTFLFSALYGSQWSALCTGHCTTNERSLKYPVNKRLVGSQTQSGCFEEENYPLRLYNISLVIHLRSWTQNQSYYSVSRKLAAIKKMFVSETYSETAFVKNKKVLSV